jgi:hypothetical protein
MRLNDFGAFFLLSFFIISLGYSVQEKHDICKAQEFKHAKCKVHKKIESLKKCCSR